MIPRSLFYPNAPDCPIPIGINQTAPTERMCYFLAKLLQFQPGDKVLEIGTGSGYQAAVLADLGAEVYSIELPSKSEPRLQQLPELRHLPIYLFRGDGAKGWPYPCIFDRILVTCAAGRISEVWREQLREEGILVVPRTSLDIEVYRKQHGKVRLVKVAGFAPFTTME